VVGRAVGFRPPRMSNSLRAASLIWMWDDLRVSRHGEGCGPDGSHK